ncbi:MAG: peptidylprolyl isomerase [Pseudomonadota bacterium]
MNARISWLSGALAFALAATAAPLTLQAQDYDADTVLVTVDGTEITLGHMIVAKGTLPAQYRQLPDEVLFPGILDQLIQQVALAQSLETPTKATELTIENQRSGLLAGEALGIVSQDAVTDEALQALYEERFSDASPTQEFNASHILVETEEEAIALIAELEGGADFAALAQEHSTGPSGPNGGALGWFGSGQMVPEFETAVLALEPGNVSPPVQTQFGWHVVILNERRMAGAPPLEEVRQELAAELESAAVEARIAEVVKDARVIRQGVTIPPEALSDMSLVAP